MATPDRSPRRETLAGLDGRLSPSKLRGPQCCDGTDRRRCPSAVVRTVIVEREGGLQNSLGPFGRGLHRRRSFSFLLVLSVHPAPRGGSEEQAIGQDLADAL